MKTCVRMLLLALCAFLVTPAQAEEATLKIEYSGVVYDAVDLTTLSDFIIISDAAAKGSFGPSDVKVLSKFTRFDPVPDNTPACEPPKVLLGMAYARSVTTYKDYSQVFIYYDNGWICVTPGLPGEASYRGWVDGNIIGGTGRFEGASGHVETEFGGFDLSGMFVAGGPAFPALGSWSGVMTGTIELGH